MRNEYCMNFSGKTHRSGTLLMLDGFDYNDNSQGHISHREQSCIQATHVVMAQNNLPNSEFYYWRASGSNQFGHTKICPVQLENF